MADNFDLQGWMRENKQGPFSGFSSKKEIFKSSKPKSKTGLNEGLMGMIDIQPVGSLSEDLNEGSFIIDYNDAEYIQYMLDQAGINAMAKQGLDDEEVEIYGDAKALNKAKKLLQKDGFEIGGPATSIGKYKHDSSQFTGEYTGMDEEAPTETKYDIYLNIGGKKEKYGGGPYSKKQIPTVTTSIWSKYGEELDGVSYEKSGGSVNEYDDMEDDSTNIIDDLQLHLYNMQNVDDFEKVDFIYNNILDEPQQQAVDQMKNSGADDYDILSYLINDILDEGDLKQVIDHFSDMDYSMNEDDEDDAPEIEDTWNKPSEFDKDDDEEKMAAMAMKQAKSGKKGMKGITADWTIDDILGDDDDDF